MRRKTAFTLVELLVVIGIISVLVSLLLPSLANARDQARQVKCLSNLRQLNVSYQAYLHESRGYNIALNLSPGNTWIHVVARFGATDDVRRCPTAHEPNPHRSIGTAHYGWTGEGDTGGWLVDLDRPRVLNGGYGINGWLYSNFVPANDNQAANVAPRYFKKFSDTRDTTPIFFDCTWVDTQPHYNETPTDLYGTSTKKDTNRVALNRHRMAIQASFSDGSAGKIPLRMLHQYHWHRTWVIRNIVLPAN